MTRWVSIRSVLIRTAVAATLGASAIAVARVAPAHADLEASMPAFRMFSVAGSGSARFGGDGGPATRAGLRGPKHVAALPDGGFLVSTAVDGRVRRVWPSGVITTVAGTGKPGFRGDGGPAIRASLMDGPLVASPDGGFWIGARDRVRRVWPDGTITTVAGSGHHGTWVEGANALASPLQQIEGLSLVSDGSLLVSDANLYRIMRVGPEGTITTVAGTGEAGDDRPDPLNGSPATGAALGSPYGVAALPDGGALVTSGGDSRVYRLTPDGRIVYAVGSGNEGLGVQEGRPALKADLSAAAAVSASDGSVIVAANDAYIARVGPDGRLRRLAGIDRDNTETPFIGSGAGLTNGYGLPAREARTGPNDLAPTAEGGVLVADPHADRVVYLAPAHTAQPAVAITAMRNYRDRVTVSYAASVAGRLQVRIVGHGHLVARAEFSAARAGRVVVRVGAVGGLLEAEVRLTASGHVPVFDRSGIVVRRLSTALARAMAERDEMVSGYTPHVRRCARHSALRVDCEMRFPQLYARDECPAVLQMIVVRGGTGIQVRGTPCPKDRSHPFPEQLASIGSETYTLPALATTYDYVFTYRRECLGPHTPGIHASNCRYGFGPGVRIGRVVAAPKPAMKAPPVAGQHFQGSTSQGSSISFTYDAATHTITEINTSLRFRCAGGKRSAGAYGGFTVHVRPDGTFSTDPNAHGYFRGHFVSAHLVKGRVLLKPAFVEPRGCSSGHVRFAAQAARGARVPRAYLRGKAGPFLDWEQRP